MCIINEKKYATFENTFMLEELVTQVENLKIEDIKIKNPDNPAKLINAKLITFFVKGENE